MGSTPEKITEKYYTLVGDYSGASYNVATLDISSVNVAAVVTEPDPTSSLPNANYGYIETITEWPDTLS